MPQSDIDELKVKLKKSRKRIKALEREIQDVRTTEAQLQEKVAMHDTMISRMGIKLREVMKKVGVSR